MRRAVLAGVLLLHMTASAVSAQQWHLEAQAGRIRSALDPASTASESVVLGLRYEQLNSGFRVSAGVPTTAEQPLWAAVAGAHRFAFQRNGFTAGVDLAGNALLLRDRAERTQEVEDVFRRRSVVPAPSLSGFAGSLQALPVIGYGTARVQAQLRAGMSLYSGEFGEQQRDRTIRMADAQLTLLPSQTLALIPSVRYFDAEEADYRYAGLTSIAAFGSVSVWASAGTWLDTARSELSWAAGASVRYNRATITGSARRDPVDPLYLTPAQTSWNVGISLQVGGRVSTPVPVPAVYEAGRATIRLPISHSATAPRMAGDFTNWKPQPMQRSGDAWVYTVTLQPGVYNYAFVNDRGEWFVPEKYPGRKSDGMGGTVAVLVVQ